MRLQKQNYLIWCRFHKLSYARADRNPRCLHIILYILLCPGSFIIGATSWENLFLPYVNNKDADQPTHPRSLISAFVVRCLDSIILVCVSAGRKPRRQVFPWRGSFTIVCHTVWQFVYCYSNLFSNSFIIWAASWQNQNDLCAQRRLRSAQSDQSLRCPHEESLGP